MEVAGAFTRQELKVSCIAEEYGATSAARVNTGRSQTARSGQWSPDGTCIIQTSPLNALETIVVPHNLLERESRELKAHSVFSSSEAIYSWAPYPHFNLSQPETTLVLSAVREKPIQLRNALAYNDGIYASYRWVDRDNETNIAPMSIAFTPDGKHFVAGSRARFAVFDVDRPANGLVQERKTSRRKKTLKRWGIDTSKDSTSPDGLISSLEVNQSGVLALGTTSREVALYEDHGVGDLITSFKLTDGGDGGPEPGRGVTQVKWSECGTYLFVAERKSDVIELYDVRRSNKRLSWMSGRNADGLFRHGFDIVATTEGYEIWAGGTDGKMRVWSRPEQQEGEVTWDRVWKVHEDPVVSTLVHPSGSVVATLALKDRYQGLYEKANDGDDPSDSSGSSDTEESDGSSESDSESDETERSASTQTLRHPSPETTGGLPSMSRLKIWAIT